MILASGLGSFVSSNLSGAMSSGLGAAASSNPYVGIPLAAVNFVSSMFGNSANRKLQEKQWEREDTAHQREVADLQAAGLSPLASLQGSASSTTIAPQVAPQFDMNTVADFYNQSMENYRQANQLRSDASEKEKDRSLQKEIVSSQISASSEALERQIEATADEGLQNRLHDAKKANDILELQLAEHDFNVSNTYDARFREEVRTFTQGASVEYFPCPPQFYEAELRSWTVAYERELKECLSEFDSVSASQFESSSQSTGVSFGDGFSGGVSGTSVGLNASSSSSESSSSSIGSSDSHSFNKSKQFMKLASWLAKNPKPVCDERLKGKTWTARYYGAGQIPSSLPRYPFK